jgi:hypothetical protein
VPTSRPASFRCSSRSVSAKARALSRKASDKFTVPLCRGHHRKPRRFGDEAVWCSRLGIDVIEIDRHIVARVASTRSGLTRPKSFIVGNKPYNVDDLNRTVVTGFAFGRKRIVIAKAGTSQRRAANSADVPTTHTALCA